MYVYTGICDEELDFLMAITIFKDMDRYLPEIVTTNKGDRDKVLRDCTKSIIENYVLHTAPKCINVSTPARAMPIRMYEDLKLNVALTDTSVFDASYREVYALLMEPLRRFLTQFHKGKNTVRYVTHTNKLRTLFVAHEKMIQKMFQK